VQAVGDETGFFPVYWPVLRAADAGKAEMSSIAGRGERRVASEVNDA